MAGGLEITFNSDYIQLIELWMCVGVLSKGVNNCCLQNTSPSFNMLNYVESCVGLQWWPNAEDCSKPKTSHHWAER